MNSEDSIYKCEGCTDTPLAHLSGGRELAEHVHVSGLRNVCPGDIMVRMYLYPAEHELSW